MINLIRNHYAKFIFVSLSLSLFISFYFNLDSIGSGGMIADFYNTWPYVELLTKSFFSFGQEFSDITPLGYMFLSWLNFFFQDQTVVRLIFCIISILLPILFYIALKNNYDDLDRNYLLLFASLIFLFPAFRSGAVWANNSVLADIFFLAFLIFHIKWLKKNDFKKISLILFLQLFFLALCVYTRQYYAIFYLYAMYIYFQKLSLKNFLTISLIVFILAIPGFWLIFGDTRLLTTSIFSPKIYNTLLISPSIISLYLIPIFFLLYIQKSYTINLKDKNLFIPAIFFSLLILSISYIFDYNISKGGGFFIKISYLFFKNNFLGIITAILGLYILYTIAKENKNDAIIILLLIFAFPSRYIPQKYFEPMFFIVFFLMLNSKFPKIFLKNKKNIIFLSFYLMMYLSSAILNDIFKITKTFVN